MNVFLHFNDLRVHDNVGLARATADDTTIPVYIEDPRISDNTGRNQDAFKQRTVAALQEEYERHGAELVIKHGEVETVINELDPDTVYYNHAYDPGIAAVQRRLDNTVETEAYHDKLYVKPGLFTSEYDTFSPYYRAWKSNPKIQPVTTTPNFAEHNISSDELREPAYLTDAPEAGEVAAKEAWEAFKQNRLRTYKDERDNVANPRGVSRLSPYYAVGALSPRTVIDEVETLLDQTDDGNAIRNIAKYRSELAWREFNYHVLIHNPSVVEENYKDMEVDWSNNSDEIQAWKEGRTGIPFVDAGIRQLRSTGYMHNRLRQNVASFLTKHLLTDWRVGASFFKEYLLDHDTASNNGGWQWSASTGTDSVPVRIFNPEKQGSRYDENAEYIKKWVPELEGVDPQTIHKWTEIDHDDRDQAPEYPAPIIDFDKRYHEAKKRFNRALP